VFVLITSYKTLCCWYKNLQ